MSTARLYTLSPDLKYFELFKRNQPLIDKETQLRIKNLSVLVAGCGSTGGAFIEGASRLGVLNFKLVEPDHFELHNLNRQFVYPTDIGYNKAVIHQKRLASLFDGMDSTVTVTSSGLSHLNAHLLIDDVDLVFDAIDVTTSEGMKAKLTLHKVAALKNKPVFSALDLGFKQWIRYYDYRVDNRPLNGLMAETEKIKNPLKALIHGFCPLTDLPNEILHELKRLLNGGDGACQVASSCHLLSSLTGPLILRFCQNKEIAPVTSIDLSFTLETTQEQKEKSLQTEQLIYEIENFLNQIS